MSAKAAIEINALQFRYDSGEAWALQDLSLQIPRGSCFGLLGPNGAGKTTLLSILMGLLPAGVGHVRVAGFDLPADLAAIKARCALVPQDYAFYPGLTGLENLRFFADVYGLNAAQRRQRLEHGIAIAGLGEHLAKRAEHYSGGLKRRLNLAIGLLNAPEILYLDEPTVGIDALSRQMILAAIRELRNSGTTLIYTSHYMEEVESLCDAIAIIHNGRLVTSGTVAELLARQAGPELQLQLEQPPDAVAFAALQAWSPQALGTRGLMLSLSDSRELPQVLAACTSRGLTVQQLRFGADRLEQLYLRAIQ
jgi:ABC-2 type transport system ATP-binding protein